MPPRPDLLPTLLPLLLWVAAGIFPAFYLATLLHEIGHAVAGRLLGFAVTSFGMGVASPLLSVNVPGTATRFYVCRRSPLQGVTWFVQTDLLPSRGRFALLTLGGALANLLGFGVLLLFWRLTGWLPTLILAVPNAALAAFALVPYSYALPGSGVRLYSDGALVLARLLGRAHRRVYSPRLVLGMAPLWEAVGDQPMLGVQRLAAALHAAEIGDDPGARRYREAASDALAAAVPSSGPLLRTFLAPYAHLIDGQVHAYAGRREAAADSLRAAEEAFRANGYGSAARLTEVLRHAAAPQEAESLRAAEAALARIADGQDRPRSPRPHPALALATYESWLRVHLRALQAHALPPTPPERLETILARYEAAARRSRDHLADLRVYAALARYRRETGDAGAAAVAEHRAREAARAVDAALGDDAEARRAFARRAAAEGVTLPPPPPSGSPAARTTRR